MTTTSTERRAAASARRTPTGSPPRRRSAARRAPTPAAPRAPFVLLVIGLLGGALVSLLYLNTVLAEDSFRLDSVKQSTARLSQQEQALEQEIARAQSPEELARRAKELGMVPGGDPRFVDARTGQVYGRDSGDPAPTPTGDQTSAVGGGR